MILLVEIGKPTKLGKQEKITRVYVGPELRRADAEKIQRQLKQRDDISEAYLRRYKAES